jgi:anti-sigma regulatory factor (Ser/Thr protein kinase)
MRKSFPAESSSLFPVREFVRDRAVGSDLTEQEADEIVLAVSDACALLLRHSLDTVIELSWEGGVNEVLVTVEDRGEILVWAEEGRIRPEEIALISDLVDEVRIGTTVGSGGTLITMHKRLAGRGGP